MHRYSKVQLRAFVILFISICIAVILFQKVYPYDGVTRKSIHTYVQEYFNTKYSLLLPTTSPDDAEKKLSPFFNDRDSLARELADVMITRKTNDDEKISVTKVDISVSIKSIKTIQPHSYTIVAPVIILEHTDAISIIDHKPITTGIAPVYTIKIDTTTSPWKIVSITTPFP